MTVIPEFDAVSNAILDFERNIHFRFKYGDFEIERHGSGANNLAVFYKGKPLREQTLLLKLEALPLLPALLDIQESMKRDLKRKANIAVAEYVEKMKMHRTES